MLEQSMCAMASPKISQNKMPGFKAWYKQTRIVWSVLGRRFYTDRLRFHFRTIDFPDLHDRLKAGAHEPIEERFVSLMHFLIDVIPMRRAFMMH